MKIKPVGGLLSWANSHPLTTSLLTLLFFAAVPFTISAKPELTDNPYAWSIGAAIVFGLGIWWLVALWRHNQNLIIVALLIAASLFSTTESARSAPQPDPKPAAAIGVGAVILCVGGYCVYKIWKTCDKLFPPKNTNAPPQEFTAAGSEYGGAMEYSSIGSCWVPPPSDFTAASDQKPNPTTFSLNVLLEPGGLTTTMSADNREGVAQTWAEFQAEMAEHGLFLTGHGAYLPQFELGGVRCDPSMVPLEFDPLTGRVIHNTGGELRRVIVERSPNLTDWYPLLRTDVSEGTGFKVVDTTVGFNQMFYRVQVTQP